MTDNKHQKSCIACAEPIAVKANKCKHCDSFQDYRKHFTFSNSILSLLVALVSVLALTAPIFKSALEPRDAYIDFVSATADENFIYLLVSNKGNEAGTFNEADLFFIDDNKDVFVVELTVINKDNGSIFFKPKESKLLRLTTKTVPILVSEVEEPKKWNGTRYMLHGYYSTYDGIGGSQDVYSSNTKYQNFIDSVSTEVVPTKGSNN